MTTDTDTNTSTSSSSDSVGQGDYVVQAGDCMESIAVGTGYFWKTLWNLPENSDLKEKRDPNLLLPGDRVTIPPIRTADLPRPVEARHKFKKLGVPSHFQIRFLDDKQKPRADLKYILTIDGVSTKGALDANGSLKVPIPPNASQGNIQLQTDPDPEIHQLNFGHLDPIDSPTGVRGRLINLGYPCAPDGDWDPDLAAALRDFQTAQDLDPSGNFDDQTKQALEKVYQC
jgi:hypothetical protein